MIARSLPFQTKVLQAPMAGCTDIAFRLLSRAYGLKFAMTEMVAAEGLIRKNKKTYEFLRQVPLDKPLGAQIVGANPSSMAEAAQMIEALGFDLLDINFGCPVPKIAGKGAGCALLGKPLQAKEILTSIMKKTKKIPVTVKTRLGIKDASAKEAIAMAQIAQDCGVSALTIHGRTKVQGYSGHADYEAIGRVKDSVLIPVFGNGDIYGPEDAERMIKTAAVDGVMIGRGGLGNPWIFEHIEQALEGKSFLPPSFDDKKKALLMHLDLELNYRDEKQALLHMRRIGLWYFKNTAGVTKFRQAMNLCKSIRLMRRMIEDYLPSLT